MSKRSKKPILQLYRQPEIEMVNGEFPNPFAEMFWRVNNIPVTARDQICKQCNWSIPTFYRKLRAATRNLEGSDGKVRSVSSAEMFTIKAIYVKIFEEALAALKATNIDTFSK